MNHSKQNRREFLTLGMVASPAAVASHRRGAPGHCRHRRDALPHPGPKRGRRYPCSAWAVITSAIRKDEQESIRIVRTALDNGVNFMDNCWDYNGGESEVRMGKALRDGLSPQSFPDDEGRWPTEGSCYKADRRVVAAPTDRPSRLAPIP